MRRLAFLAAPAALLGAPAAALPVEYDGIVFPAGDVSFADAVVSADLGAGTTIPAGDPNDDPAEALGPPSPDEAAYTLGVGGSIVLRFVDNALSGSGDAADDLHVFEVGPDVEDTFVAISVDGAPGSFLEVGKVFGATASIDIDPFLGPAGFDAFTAFSYVRLTDDPDEGAGNPGSLYAGADIDALGAIRSVAPPPPPEDGVVPLPGALPLAALGVASLALTRRRRRG